MTLSAIEVNQLKQAPAVEGVLPVVHARWSPRAFTPRDMNPADLKKLFEAARWAASSYNEQPWRFLVGRRGSSAYMKIFDSLVERNQAWAGSAPVLILGVTKSTFSHNGSPNRVALYDLGAAAALFCLQATALGLSAHQMAGFNPKAARAAFGIPEDFIAGAVIALGYQGEPSTLPDDEFIAAEIAPRTRRPWNESFLSAWDEPLDLG
jgi:nitroreductase